MSGFYRSFGRTSADARFVFQLCLRIQWAHDKIRKGAQNYAKKACSPLIKNNRFFVQPQKTGDNFKQLFARLAAAGAGRPVDENGFPDGPWTPETLAVEISSIDANRNGIELRAVQVWFQDNDNGISNDNIRWVARIFGCDDPEMASLWQAELTASKERLAAQRRAKRRSDDPTQADSRTISEGSQPSTGSRSIDAEQGDAPKLVSTEGANTEYASSKLHPDEETNLAELRTWFGKPPKASPRRISGQPQPRFNFALWSERLFLGGSQFGAIVVLWSAIAVLLFLSYIYGVHNVTYSPTPELSKQVGLLWSPNWTLDRLLWLPLLILIVSDALTNWQETARSSLTTQHLHSDSKKKWPQMLASHWPAFLIVFAVCLLVVFFLQWYGAYLRPLSAGDPGQRVVDWLLVSIERPDLKFAKNEAVAVSGFANLTSGVGYWFCFSGLMLMYFIARDFCHVCSACSEGYDAAKRREAFVIGTDIVRRVFCCTLLALIPATTIKLVAIYLSSDAENIVGWLVGDALAAFDLQEMQWGWFDKSPSASITSFFLLFVPCFVFGTSAFFVFKALQKLGEPALLASTVQSWSIFVVVLVLFIANFCLVGQFSGFSVLFCFTMLVSIGSLLRLGFSRSGNL